MSEIVSKEFSEERILDLIAFYQPFQVENANQYIRLQAKVDGCVVSIYNSNKVVFQGKNASYEASIWQNDHKWLYQNDHMGSDEVGTGDYFGPVCVVACLVKNSDIDFINQLGVKDSKGLTDEKIKQIAPKLLQRLTYSSLVLDNVKYNEMVSKGFNMNKLKAYLHNHALNELQKKTKKDYPAVVDQFCEEKLYYRYLDSKQKIFNNITFTTKGESYSPAIAASSIIARYNFLNKLELINQKYKVIVPKGAGFNVDEFAKNFYLKYGKEEYEKIVKLNFKNTQKVLNLLNQIML